MIDPFSKFFPNFLSLSFLTFKKKKKSLPCIPGEYIDEIGKTDCVLCAAQTFSAEKNRKTPCDACPKGRTADEGSTACSSCAPGKIVAGDLTCVECIEGQYSDKANAEECYRCERGSTSKTGAPECSGCDLGKYGSTEGKCTDCPKGWYSNKGSTECIKCKLGELDNGVKTACSLCDLGKFGSSEGICTLCSEGTFQDTKGESSCQKCPVDTFLSDKGKSSKADCQMCTTDKSTGKLTANKNSSACLCKRTLYYTNSSDDTCNQCPTGADCSHKDGLTLPQLVALPGYWRPNATSPVFSDCQKGYSGTDQQDLAQQRCCPPGKCSNDTSLMMNENGTMFSHPDDQCLEGYSGVLCLVCAENYVMQGNGCVECPGGANFTSALISLIIFAIVVFFILLVVFLCAPSKKSEETGESIFGQGMFCFVFSLLHYRVSLTSSSFFFFLLLSSFFVSQNYFSIYSSIIKYAKCFWRRTLAGTIS